MFISVFEFLESKQGYQWWHFGGPCAPDLNKDVYKISCPAEGFIFLVSQAASTSLTFQFATLGKVLHSLDFSPIPLSAIGYESRTKPEYDNKQNLGARGNEILPALYLTAFFPQAL